MNTKGGPSPKTNVWVVMATEAVSACPFDGSLSNGKASSSLSVAKLPPVTAAAAVVIVAENDDEPPAAALVTAMRLGLVVVVVVVVVDGHAAAVLPCAAEGYAGKVGETSSGAPAPSRLQSGPGQRPRWRAEAGPTTASIDKRHAQTARADANRNMIPDRAAVLSWCFSRTVVIVLLRLKVVGTRGCLVKVR